VRPTFTLHARFRYARSTFVNLYLNYKSNLRVLSLLRLEGCARALTLQRHAHFVPGSLASLGPGFSCPEATTLPSRYRTFAGLLPLGLTRQVRSLYRRSEL
jgi:hypothetical protein